MTRAERWLAQLSNLAVACTGLAYAAMKYLLEPSDPFSVINHPLQPLMLTLHLLSAPLLVLAAGVLWRGHAAERLRSNRTAGRISGLGLALVFLPMALSGYMLQTAAAPGWRHAWLAVHLAASAAWILLFLGHMASFLAGRMRTVHSGRFATANGFESVEPVSDREDNRGRRKPAAWSRTARAARDRCPGRPGAPGPC